MRPGFPHVDRVNQLIRRAIEMGLIQKWAHDNEVYAARVANSEENDIVKPLSVAQISAGCVLMMLGISAAILTFIAEILLFKQLKKVDNGCWYRFMVWMKIYILQPGRSICKE